MKCITASRLDWIKDIRGLGYDVIWVDALFTLSDKERGDA